MVSLADNGQSPLEVPSLYTAATVREHLDKGPEPCAVIGSSLPLIFLVIRPQGSRGCPSAESDPNWTGHRLEPAALSRPGRGHRSVSRTWDFRVPLFPAERHTGTSILNRCLGSPWAVASIRNQVSRKHLASTIHQLLPGRPPRPRDASVCPLDNGGLISVRRCLSRTSCPRPCYLSAWKYFAATSWPSFFPMSVPTSVEVR